MSQMITSLITVIGVLASPVLVAIFAPGFLYRDPAQFDLAGDMLEAQADRQEVVLHLFKTKPLAMLQLWGRVLSRLEASQEASQVDDDDEVVFDDLEGDSDDEMDEEMIQFEFPANSGEFYFRTDDDMVFADDEGSASIGQWDAEDQTVIFDE